MFLSYFSQFLMGSIVFIYLIFWLSEIQWKCIQIYKLLQKSCYKEATFLYFFDTFTYIPSSHCPAWEEAMKRARIRKICRLVMINNMTDSKTSLLFIHYFIYLMQLNKVINTLWPFAVYILIKQGYMTNICFMHYWIFINLFL